MEKRHSFIYLSIQPAKYSLILGTVIIGIRKNKQKFSLFFKAQNKVKGRDI